VAHLLLAVLNNHKEAVQFATAAIDESTKDTLQVEPSILADMYVLRMKCYKELGLNEHARQDYQRVLNADPNFIRREMAAK
jgi:Tfp pilus assembly protein PilF